MGISTLLIVSLGLSIDCFTVATAIGAVAKTFKWKDLFLLVFFMGFFQGMFALFGAFLGSRFQYQIENYDHWVSFGLLFILAIRMAYEGAKHNSVKILYPLKVITALGLATATSIDALAVGISMGLLNMNLFWPATTIAIFSHLMAFMGYFFGMRYIKLSKLRVEYDWAIILFSLRVKILFDHLGH